MKAFGSISWAFNFPILICINSFLIWCLMRFLTKSTDKLGLTHSHISTHGGSWKDEQRTKPLSGKGSHAPSRLDNFSSFSHLLPLDWRFSSFVRDEWKKGEMRSETWIIYGRWPPCLIISMNNCRPCGN